MALILERQYPDQVAQYHRISELKIGRAGKPCCVTVESYADRSARSVPGAQCHRTAYDFMRVDGSDVFSQAYRALLAMEEWADAQSDVNALPSPIPAVLAGTMRWDEDGQEWQPLRPEPTAEEVARLALDAIDVAAGRTRLKYITSVPGQAETYQRKEQQARDWAGAGFTGNAPSFIAAEAAALGRTAQSVAEEVIALAEYWAEIKGPEIEACRRKWKVAIEAAGADKAAIELARAGGEAELAGL